MRHNVAPGATNCRARLVTYGPTRPHHHPNYKRRVERRAARHTASLYASPGSAFHALLCALRAQRVAETELGMQLRYTPRSAPLRAASLCATPLGAVPLCAVPLCAVPPCAASLCTATLSAAPLCAVPLCATPLGAASLTDESKIHPCCHLPVAAALLSLLCTAKQASLSNQLRWSLRSAPRRSAPRTRGVPRVSAQTLQSDPPPSLLARSSSRFVFRV